MISLIHPSRGRPSKALKTMSDWSIRAGMRDFEYIISVDSEDPKAEDYKKYFPEWITVNNNLSVVDATNKAAAKSSGDILVYLSDDFDCPDFWVDLVEREFEGCNEPRLIKVDDCLQPFGVAVLTIPIMNRQLYERLGYFWHPSYRSMFVDEDLYWTASKLGALKLCPGLRFPHNHVSIGKAEDDETYKRSAANWDQGKQTFEQRKRLGFPA